jgi:hypothetical protein
MGRLAEIPSQDLSHARTLIPRTKTHMGSYLFALTVHELAGHPPSLSLSLFFFLCFSERPRSAACLPANPLIHRNSELSFYPTLERKNNQLILIYSIPRRILLLYIFSFFFFFLKGETQLFSLSLSLFHLSLCSTFFVNFLNPTRDGFFFFFFKQFEL